MGSRFLVLAFSDVCGLHIVRVGLGPAGQLFNKVGTFPRGVPFVKTVVIRFIRRLVGVASLPAACSPLCGENWEMVPGVQLGDRA